MRQRAFGYALDHISQARYRLRRSRYISRRQSDPKERIGNSAWANTPGTNEAKCSARLWRHVGDHVTRPGSKLMTEWMPQRRGAGQDSGEMAFGGGSDPFESGGSANAMENKLRPHGFRIQRCNTARRAQTEYADRQTTACALRAVAVYARGAGMYLAITMAMMLAGRRLESKAGMQHDDIGTKSDDPEQMPASKPQASGTDRGSRLRWCRVVEPEYSHLDYRPSEFSSKSDKPSRCRSTRPDYRDHSGPFRCAHLIARAQPAPATVPNGYLRRIVIDYAMRRHR